MEIRKTYPKLSGKPYNKTIFKFHTRMTKEKNRQQRFDRIKIEKQT